MPTDGGGPAPTVEEGEGEGMVNTNWVEKKVVDLDVSPPE